MPGEEGYRVAKVTVISIPRVSVGKGSRLDNCSGRGSVRGNKSKEFYASYTTILVYFEATGCIKLTPVNQSSVRWQIIPVTHYSPFSDHIIESLFELATFRLLTQSAVLNRLSYPGPSKGELLCGC